mmetsp:Transcript_1229/g.3937  ORF Transcript_1229/g.3937 Transcript_1229/m.3937 type:complete len:443 (+) Transcript_1229:23-1351(+)
MAGGEIDAANILQSKRVRAAPARDSDEGQPAPPAKQKKPAKKKKPAAADERQPAPPAKKKPAAKKPAKPPAKKTKPAATESGPQPEYRLDLEAATEQARHALEKFGEAQSWTTTENDAIAEGVHDEAARAEIMECSYSRQWGWFVRSDERDFDEHPFLVATDFGRDAGPHGPWAPEEYEDAPFDGERADGMMPDGRNPLGEIRDYKCVAAFREAQVHLTFGEKKIRAPEGLEESGPDDYYFSGSVRVRRGGDDRLAWATLCRWEYMVEGCQEGETYARGALCQAACLEFAELVSGDEGAGAWRPRDLLQLVWRLCAAPFDWFYAENEFMLRYVEDDEADNNMMTIPGVLRVHLLDVAGAADDEEYLGSDEFPGYAKRLFEQEPDTSNMLIHPHDGSLDGAVIRSCANGFGLDGNSACVTSIEPVETAAEVVLGSRADRIPIA